MTFLSPLFLWALPLAGIPLVLHLLNRRPPQKVVFSYIGWLKEAHQNFMPKKKLQEWLLLAVRTLLLLFLVLFFSRPVLQSGFMRSSQSQNSSIIVVLDVSASMGAVVGGVEVLEVAKQKLQQVVARIPGGVKLGLVEYSDRVESQLAPTAEHARILSAVLGSKVAPRPTNVLPALQMAMQMLGNQSAGNKSILIVSDQASNGWEQAKNAQGHWQGFDPSIGIVAWELSGPVSNSGIAEANLQLSEEGTLKGRWLASVDPATHSNWQLKLDGRGVDGGSLSELKDRSVELPLQAQLPEGGFYSGTLELSPDALRCDDIFYLAGRVPKGFHLLVVDGKSGLAPSDTESYYLRLALESPRDPRLESIQVIRPELLPQEHLANYDAIVLANTGPLEAQEEDLTKWIEGGGGLFLTAGSKWPKPPDVPLKLFRSRGLRSERQSVEPPKPDAPLLSDIAGLEGFQWNQIMVQDYIALEPESDQHVLLRLADGAPLLIQKQLGRGFVLCLTSSIDRSWTNLPAKPVFAPLIRELIAALADPLREQTSLNGFVDEALRIRMPAGVREATVVAPDGSTAGARVDKDGYLVWQAPNQPGLFRVMTDKKSSDFSFAVNIRDLAKEGDTSRISERDLKDALPGCPQQWIGYKTSGTDIVVASLEGRDTTFDCLAVALAAFFAETFLAWPKRKRSRVVLKAETAGAV